MKTSFSNLLLLGCLAILLAGCNPIMVADSPETPTQPPGGITTSTETQTMPTEPPQHDDMPRDPPLLDPASPESQTLIGKAKADLAQRLSIPASQINTLEIQGVLWPDDSLGCPQPGLTYTQAPVPGYLITLESDGNEFEYHANLHDSVFYCENPTPPIQAPP